jgi:hypothetical protein
MSTKRVAGCLGITLLALGLGAGITSAEESYSGHGEWPPDWPKELAPWRSHATTYRIAPAYESGVYTVSFKDRKAFEKGWPALLRVARKRDATLTLVSNPVEDLTREKLGHKPPGRPSLQITCHWRTGEDGKILQGEIIHSLVLSVDARIVDLNRIRIPGGFEIEDRRVSSEDSPRVVCLNSSRRLPSARS